jgi:hypothetical protein
MERRPPVLPTVHCQICALREGWRRVILPERRPEARGCPWPAAALWHRCRAIAFLVGLWLLGNPTDGTSSFNPVPGVREGVLRSRINQSKGRTFGNRELRFSFCVDDF